MDNYTVAENENFVLKFDDSGKLHITRKNADPNVIATKAKATRTETGGAVVECGMYRFFFEADNVPYFIVEGMDRQGTVLHSFLSNLPLSFYGNDSILWVVPTPI